MLEHVSEDDAAWSVPAATARPRSPCGGAYAYVSFLLKNEGWRDTLQQHQRPTTRSNPKDSLPPSLSSPLNLLAPTNNMVLRRHERIPPNIVAIAWISLCLLLLNTKAALGISRPFGLQTKNHLKIPSAIRLNLPLDLTSGSSSIAQFRGGAAWSDDDDEEEEEEDESETEDEEEEEDEEDSGVSNSTNGNSNSPANLIISTLKSVSKALMRGVTAAIQSLESDSDKDEDASIVGRVVQMVQSFWSAALNSGSNKKSDNPPSPSKPPKSTPKETVRTTTEPAATSSTTTPTSDFGTYLAQTYGVADGRTGDDNPVLGGSLNDALKVARANARLLLVLIPNKGKNDKKAVEGFLSSQVATMAKKKARKKGETGSFLLWGAKAGSSEATQAMKRFKVKPKNSKGEKIPILLVAYPAQGFSKGVLKIAPKVLAQHHCSPPPSADTMMEWLNDLRKRHAKQYDKMQLDRREAQLYQERKAGYQESVKSDVDRKIREKKEEEERIAKEKAEKERLAALEQRRKELLESLPEEPKAGNKDAMTLSIRLADGRSGKRRFAKETELSIVFNWVDASFQMERETVVLTTMNGKQTFNWEDTTDEKTLADAGLGRMVGFRVSENKPGDEKSGDEKEETAKEEA
ncbi:UBX domain-containing protein [Seminavis robusta]|uniref:UBX domain-containing protein n=1 Tax=Seminavis robusta TaxID=568900 RepID=A0A9N8E9Q1_9STRA|nr:UBX domain-containing protein [Seminavis robusta]|eukprot:Sro650_g181400.1 UBX domain-containing protein (633) ;mRNA; f:30978-32981